MQAQPLSLWAPLLGAQLFLHLLQLRLTSVKSFPSTLRPSPANPCPQEEPNCPALRKGCICLDWCRWDWCQLPKGASPGGDLLVRSRKRSRLLMAEVRNLLITSPRSVTSSCGTNLIPFLQRAWGWRGQGVTAEPWVFGRRCLWEVVQEWGHGQPCSHAGVSLPAALPL